MIPVKVLAVRYLSSVPETMRKALGTEDACLGLITTDCDDATYIALDQATKDAQVSVCYGGSFYAGAGNSTTPYAGEVLGKCWGSWRAPPRERYAAAWSRH